VGYWQDNAHAHGSKRAGATWCDDSLVQRLGLRPRAGNLGRAPAVYNDAASPPVEARGKARFSLRLLQHSLVWDRLLYDGPKFVALVLFLALPAVVGSLLADRAGAALARLVNSAGIVGTVF
jgi:hypothetical protein